MRTGREVTDFADSLATSELAKERHSMRSV